MVDGGACKNWSKNLYLHFYKNYDHQIWQADTSTGVDSNKINQIDAGNVITWRLRDKLKSLYLYYQIAYGHQTWQDGNLPWWALALKVKCHFDHMVL